MLKEYKIGPLFTPPIVAGTDGLLGTLQIPAAQGSALWQGAAWDPETNMLYVPSVTNMTAVGAAARRRPLGHELHRRRWRRWRRPRRARRPVARAGRAGPAPQRAPSRRWSRRPQMPQPGARRRGGGGGRGGGGRGGGNACCLVPARAAVRGESGPQGLPLVKPPYGRITAYNMNTGDIVWQVANGDTYEWIKTHPALKGVTIPKTGRADEGGIVVTKTLMFAGQGCGLFRGGGGGGPMFYAYDKATGAVVHEMQLPANTCGNPMTYMVNGKQYIVVAVGAQNFPAELVALSLPD